LIRRRHEKGRACEGEGYTTWVKYGVANDAPSGKGRCARNPLCIAKIAADNRPNKITLVKGTGEGTPSIQNNGNDGVCGGLVINVVEFGAVHGHKAFRGKRLGLSIGTV
jgi:hypothetical protein